MSPRSVGVAILIHAALITAALNTLDDRDVASPSPAVLRVAPASVASAPDGAHSPALSRGQPVPELESRGESPVPVWEPSWQLEINEPEPPAEAPGNQLPEHTPEVDPVAPPSAPSHPLRLPDPAPDPSHAESPAQPGSAAPDASHTGAGAATGTRPPEAIPVLLDPDWPRALRRDFTGKVSVRVLVGTHGRALRVELLQGTGRSDMDTLVTRTFEQAMYQPGQRRGTAVICEHTFHVHFKRSR